MQATRCGMLKIKNKNKSKFQGVACSNKKKFGSSLCRQQGVAC
jgi:hypothetical protein